MELAAETMCLVASAEQGAPLLAPVLITLGIASIVTPWGTTDKLRLTTLPGGISFFVCGYA